jgi:hypothetical protein
MIILGDLSRTADMINSLAQDTRNLLKAAFEISYFSRGAWPYDLVLQMSPLERDLAIEFINKRLEAAGKSMHPIY